MNSKPPIHEINPTQLEVAFSDEVLLLVSLLGFTFLFAALACLCHFSPSQAKYDENGGGAGSNNSEQEDTYDQSLVDADVSTLNRAQRKARAKLLMKRRKRAAANNNNIIDINEQRRGEGGGEGGANENNNGHVNNNEDDRINNNNNDNNGEIIRNDHTDIDENENTTTTKLSRKERQKAAKEEERSYRREYEEIRKLKNEKERQRIKEAKKIRLLEKKQLMELERQEAFEQEIKAWKYLFYDNDDDDKNNDDYITVHAFVKELEKKQVIDLEDTAHRFSVSIETLVDRINGLERDGRIYHGILDRERGKYYFISPSDMKTISTFIKNEKFVSTKDIISMVSSVISSKTYMNDKEEGDKSKI